MKLKSFLKNLKKIPFLGLLVCTIFLADAVDDGILPWSSPFHISLAQTDRSDDAFIIADIKDRASNDNADTEIFVNADASALGNTDVSTGAEGSHTGGSSDTDTDANGNGTDAVSDTETDANGTGGASDTGADANGTGGASDTGADANGTGGASDTGADGNGTDGASDTGADENGMNGVSDHVTDGGDIDSSSDSPSSADHVWQANPSGYDGTVVDDGNSSMDAPDSEADTPEEGEAPTISYMTVEDDYFDDAVFIGDSRTRSLQLYANLENSTFLTYTGLTIYGVLDTKLTPSTTNTKTTVPNYLSSHQFKKIYLMLGINELGTGTAESFCRTYSNVLDTLHELQPDAIIYLQAILHISKHKDDEHTYINNDTIVVRNEALQSLANNEYIFWLDSNPVLCDENGYLISDYTSDGVHLQAKYVYLWMDYLKQHAIQQEPSPTPSPEVLPPEPQTPGPHVIP